MFWQQVHQLDQQVTLVINSWHSAVTDPIWQFFSDKIVWIPMYVAIIALLIWKLGWKKGLMVIAAAGLTFGFCDQFYFSKRFKDKFKKRVGESIIVHPKQLKIEDGIIKVPSYMAWCI